MGFLIYILPILIAVGLGIVQFDAGKRQIANLLAQALGPGNEVEFGDFSGSPVDLRLENLTIRDADGVWFDLDGFRFQWSPSGLLRGRLVIDELSIAQLTLERPPPAKQRQMPPPDEQRRFEIPGLPGGLRGLAVEQVAVDRLTLGAPVLGERAVFAVEGRLQARDPQQQFELAMRIDRQDEPTAHLTASAELMPRENAPPMLTVDIEAEETGGLFAAIAGAAPSGADLALSLKGTAPVSDWSGRLTGSAGGLGSVDAQLGLQAATDLSSFKATADGRLDPAPGLLPAGAEPLLDPGARFTLRLQRPADGDQLILERLALATNALNAEAQAGIDLAAQTADGSFKLRVPRLAALEELAGTPLAGALTAEGRFAGPLALPEADVDIAIEDVDAAGVAVRRLTGDLRLAPLGEAGDRSGLRLDGNGRIAGLLVEGAPSQEPNDLAWAFDLTLPEGGPIDLRRLTLTGDAVALAAAGRIEGDAFTTEATLDVADLERLVAQNLTGLPTAPRLQVTAEGRLGQPLTAAITGRLDRLEPLPPALAALLGGDVAFAADLALAEDGALAIRDVSVDGKAAALTAEAALGLAAQELQARFDLTVPRLAVLSPAVMPGLSGSLRLEGEARGPLGNPTVTATIDSDRLAVSGQVFDRASARLRAETPATAPHGTAALALTRAGETVHARTGFGLRDGALLLSDLALDPGAEIEGEVAIELDRILADGTLRAESRNLDALMRFFDLDAGGDVTLDLRFEPGSEGQRLAADLRGSDVFGPFGAIGTAAVEADLRNAFADPQADVDITLSNLKQGEATVEDLTASLQGNAQRLTFAAEADGTVRDPFSVETAGSFSAVPDGSDLTLTRLEGDFAGEPLALAEPVTLRLRADGAAVDRLLLTVAGAQVEATGGYGSTGVDLQASIAELPLGLAERFGGPPLAGQASATLTVSGTVQQPDAVVAVTASDIKVDDPAFGDAPPLDLALEARLRDERLQMQLRAARLFEEPVTASASLPLQLSLQPFALAMPENGAIDGRLQAEAELPRIASLLLLDDQRMTGALDVDLTLGGTVAEPRLHGGAQIVDGAYQNLVTGTVLAGIDARITANGTTILIQDLNATDGGKGTIGGAGSIDLAAGGTFPFALDLAFDKAVLVRRDEGAAEASGDLAFTGNLGGDALLSGDIAVGPAQIRIPDRLPPSIVELEVIEIGEGGEIIARPDAGADMLGADAVRLQLAVRAERVFVRGRGLESEWQGRVRIAGTAAQPEIVGRLEVRRGFVDFLGRRLDLTRGIISFPGAQPPAPNIDAVASADIGDGVTAEIGIRGDATAPEIVVSSQPELPQDEVLARLLFGRDLSTITPFQAVRLAAAVNALRGGGGVDLLGETRELLGVDVLDIETTESTTAGTGEAGETGTDTTANTTVGVGKYLTDRVFVEVERGIAADSGAVSVEIEVTPNITVDTEVGANAQTGVGVKWRYDY